MSPIQRLSQSALKAGLFLFGLPFLIALFFPAMGVRRCGPMTAPKNDVMQIVNALKYFHDEYNHYPIIPENGFCNSADANAKLIEILCGLNPRKIRLLEIPPAKEKHGLSCSGIDPTTGAWNDPWGNFYRIQFITESSPKLRSPYSDDTSFPSETTLIAWSLGKDGIQGDPRNPTKVGSDDVMSWRQCPPNPRRAK
jgi:hypothetical protein